MINDQRSVLALVKLRIEHIPQPIPQKEYNQYNNYQQNPGKEGDPPGSAKDIFESGADKRSQRGFGNGHTQTQKREGGLTHDRIGDLDGGKDQNRGEGIG